MKNFLELHLNIRLRIISISITTLTGGMILPFMVIYVTMYLGSQLAGILLMINVVLNIIVGLASGHYTDLIGRKKILIATEVASFITIVIMIIFNLIIKDSYITHVMTTLMFVINNLCYAATTPASNSMLIDASNEKNRPFMYSILYWVQNFSLIVGGILGGFLFKEYFVELLVFLAISTLISAILILFSKEIYIKKDKNVFQSNEMSLFKSYSIVFKDKLFILFSFGYLIIISFEYHLINYFTVRLNNEFQPYVINFIDLLYLNVNGVSLMGILRSENTITVIFFFAIINKIFKKMLEEDKFFLGLTLYFIGYLTISFSNSFIILIGAMLLASIGEILYAPLYKTYLAKIPPINLRGSYIACNEIFINGGRMLAAIVLALSEYLSGTVITFFLLFLSITTLFTYCMIIPKIKSTYFQDRSKMNT